jgi:hypothetical protein
MAALNHTIVWSSDQTKSARFLAEMLGRSAPTRFGHFDVVELDNGSRSTSPTPRARSGRNTTRSSSAKRISTLFSAESASGVLTIGPIRCADAPARSIKTTAGEGSIFQTRTAITWK